MIDNMIFNKIFKKHEYLAFLLYIKDSKHIGDENVEDLLSLLGCAASTVISDLLNVDFIGFDIGADNKMQFYLKERGRVFITRIEKICEEASVVEERFVESFNVGYTITELEKMLHESDRDSIRAKNIRFTIENIKKKRHIFKKETLKKLFKG